MRVKNWFKQILARVQVEACISYFAGQQDLGCSFQARCQEIATPPHATTSTRCGQSPDISV